jgi:predicted membrane-bound spermidine synthase
VAIVIGAVIPNRIPAWLRLGVPGLVVGAILIGLLWPYVIGPLGTLPGAFLSLAGALTLVGASIASIVIDRHAARGPAV